MLSTEQLKEKMKEYLEKAGYDAQDPEKSKPILQKVCQDFYSKLLQGKSVVGKMDGQPVTINFTNKGRHKLRNLAMKNKLVDEILPYVPEILMTGKYAGKDTGYKTEFGGHQLYTGFLYFQKKIQTSKGVRNVVVDVGITERDTQQEYSFISNKDDGYPKKKEYLRSKGIIIENASVQTQPVLNRPLSKRSSDVTIPLSFEFVNVQIKNIFEDALETAYANEFHDNFSDVNYAFGLEL